MKILKLVFRRPVFGIFTAFWGGGHFIDCPAGFVEFFIFWGMLLLNDIGITSYFKKKFIVIIIINLDIERSSV